MQYSIENKNIFIRDFELNTQQGIIDSNAPTIIFLHDSLGCNALWRSFPKHLAESLGYNYLMYDRRGYGLSSPFADEPRRVNYMEIEAEILMEVLQYFNIQQPILFGHSDGGTIALLAASKYSNAFKAVITEGAHVFVEEITLDGIAHTRYQYKTTHLKERLEKYHGKNTDALFNAWTETWLSESFSDWNIESFLPNIICPVMIIQGAEDEFGTMAQVNAIAAGISGNSKICMVVNAGHSPHKQNEIWLINECAGFIENVLESKY
jgi:pimeloyl-ACP methyl ester carboxylesterase